MEEKTLEMDEKEYARLADDNGGMKKYSAAVWLKFILFSAFGVFAFFINFPLPEYQITIGAWQWGLVKAQSNVLCSHMTNFIKAALYTGNFKAMA